MIINIRYQSDYFKHDQWSNPHLNIGTVLVVRCRLRRQKLGKVCFLWHNHNHSNNRPQQQQLLQKRLKKSKNNNNSSNIKKSPKTSTWPWNFFELRKMKTWLSSNRYRQKNDMTGTKSCFTVKHEIIKLNYLLES